MKKIPPSDFSTWFPGSRKLEFQRQNALSLATVLKLYSFRLSFAVWTFQANFLFLPPPPPKKNVTCTFSSFQFVEIVWSATRLRRFPRSKKIWRRSLRWRNSPCLTRQLAVHDNRNPELEVKKKYKELKAQLSGVWDAFSDVGKRYFLTWSRFYNTLKW